MYSILIKYLLPLLLVLGGAGSSLASLGDYFVSTAWLAEQRSEVRVIDVRNPAKYLLGHVDGALNLPKEQFLERRGGVKSLVPTATQFQRLMSRLGIDEQTTVVAYAEDSNPYSARLVWTLRYHGHQQAFVLDGGYEKWALENRAVANLPTATPVPTSYRLQRSRDLRAEADTILTRLGEPGSLVWDTRSDGEYQGSDVRADRGGHIPGAVHLNWTDLQKEVNGVRVLRDEGELRVILAEHGITPDKVIAAHCQTGIRSSYATLVLLGLGYQQVKNYDGSWIEWANNPELPIEVPAQVGKAGNS